MSIGRESNNSSRLYLRYNGDDLGRAAINNSICNDIVVGDGTWIVKWNETPDSTVTFELEPKWKKRWSLKVLEEGIWMARNPGTVVFVR